MMTHQKKKDHCAEVIKKVLLSHSMNIFHRIDLRRSTRKRKVPTTSLRPVKLDSTSSDDDTYYPSTSESSESVSVGESSDGESISASSASSEEK
jgi:hypothetical protein